MDMGKLKNGIDVQDFDTIEPITLSSWDQMALVKKFEGALSVKGNVGVEASEEKFGRGAGDMKMASPAAYFGLGQQSHREILRSTYSRLLTRESPMMTPLS
ncbi:uncharacterized protein LOC118481966 isoform X2 [Helianthus annuus]|uniref:uncharacterized protein LOC118481966 isoform X2 n=1 Tax=Helianthus annuus TaxID=4232 RepID=UPI001653184B|nr:uncharacterized protein LOC118481966 isoform X2 [Helianthus annuus]